MAHVIVIGNEKGGAGKSTVSMHIATALARLEHSVCTVDLDLRQRSLGRYLENRSAFCAREGLTLPSAAYHDFQPPKEGDEIEALMASLDDLETGYDFVLIDCPGSHTPLSQVAHSRADTLVTPLNDSFIDFDLLARIDADGTTVKGPSIYSEMVWTARQRRAKAGEPPIDWVVIRNRLGSQAMVNKRKMEVAIDALSRRIGFRPAPGFSERVVFRELFPKGLTLLDLRDVGVTSLTMSNIAARQELRDLIKALDLPDVAVTF
ncbi:division plane positioning ATPase MipZ [Aestuariibius insulae]|uniref:division plane positioning ATPase MipZ n=1 Tax=Aestuariibius insulae TaxID=2058287 RepID=UPI00345EE014